MKVAAVLITLYLPALKPEFHIILTYHKIFFFF